MDTIEILKKLTAVSAVSGREHEMFEVLSELTKPYGVLERTSLNSFILKRRGKGGKKLLLDAHIDRIGLAVCEISDGFVRVCKQGGIDRRQVAGKCVCVHGKKDVRGVIGSVPPHLEKDKNEDCLDLDALYVDTGLSKEKAEELISVGDSVSFDSSFSELLNGCVSVGALDDRAGCAVLLKTMEYLYENDEAYDLSVSFVFSSQEETTQGGAKTASYIENADELIAVDVSFALAPGSSPKDCAELSKGAMIGISPVLDFEICKKLKDIAKESEISYQLEIMNGRTGTDADEMILTRGGARGALVSIPQRYMHTDIEVCSVSDIEDCAKLIAEYVRRHK